MDIERGGKGRKIDLEDSPYGNAEMIKLEAIEHSFSHLSLELFHHSSAKKEDKPEIENPRMKLQNINLALGEIVQELETILLELEDSMETE